MKTKYQPRKMSLNAAHCKLVSMVPQDYHTHVAIETDKFSFGDVCNTYKVYFSHSSWRKGVLYSSTVSFEDAFEQLSHHLSQHGPNLTA